MPLYTLLDDILFDGFYDEFRTLAFISSLYSVVTLELDSNITGEPKIFYPVDQSPETIERYIALYRLAFDTLAPYVQQNTPLAPLE